MDGAGGDALVGEVLPDHLHHYLGAAEHRRRLLRPVGDPAEETGDDADVAQPVAVGAIHRHLHLHVESAAPLV